MPQARIVLLVSTAPAVMELVRRVLLSERATVIVLEARNGGEAIEFARMQPLGLVVLDLDLAGVMSPRDISLKLRAVRPTLPILPIGTSLDAAPLLAELGCAPALSKSQLLSNPSQLLTRIHDAAEQEPVVKVPDETFRYLLEQADAALKAERRQEQLEVAVLCRNTLLRCGLVHSLTSLGIAAQIITASNSAAPLAFEAPPGARLVIGPLSDVVALQTIAQASRLPLLLVALHPRELEMTPYQSLSGASVFLFDDGGNILQFLTAVQTVASKSPFLAVPASVVARWAALPDGLTMREWEVIVALLLTANPEAVAQLSGLSPSSVETYIKRVRNKLGSRSLADTLAIVQAHVTAQLGVSPTAPSSFGDAVQAAR